MWNHKPFDQDLITGTQSVIRAIEFALWAHSLHATPKNRDTTAHGIQMREDYKTGKPVPYAVHPIRVVSLLDEFGEDPVVQRAGACHDILEDTTIKLNALENIIGRKSLEIVMWVTDHDFSGSREIRSWLKHQQISRAPRDAKAVKLADMASNTESTENGKGHFWRNIRREEMINLMEICRYWGTGENTNNGLSDFLTDAILAADNRFIMKEK